MGKAVFLNVSGGGHVIATYGLVSELISRGEEVVYYETPKFQKEIEALGATFRSYHPLPKFEAPTAGWPFHHELDLAPIITWTAIEWIPKLLEEIRAEEPDYIVHDSLCLWGRIIAELLDKPAVCSVHTPAFNWKFSLLCGRFWLDAPKMFVRSFASLRSFRRDERVLRKTYGINRTSYIDTFTNPQPVTICHTPRELQPHEAVFDDRYHFVGSVHDRPDRERSELGLYGDKLIYIGFGTICDPGPEFFRNCLEAFKDFEHHVFMILSASTQPEDLGDVPKNFTVWSLQRDGLAPQLDLLPQADLFVMNAGMGGARESAWNGVPMLAVPTTFETDAISHRIEQQGAGVRVPPKRATPERLRAVALEILAGDSYRENSRRIGDACRQAGGASRAANVVMEFVYRTKSERTEVPADNQRSPNQE